MHILCCDRKWQQLSAIDKVTVRNDTVSHFDDDLGPLTGHLVEVDLQDNLLWKWREVFHLGSQLPVLRNLLLHGNKFEPVTPPLIQSLPR